MSLNLIPHTSTPLAELLTRAAVAPIQNVGWIRVTGEDRVRWLNGMVTNSIQSLKLGEGCYCFFLNAQGKIQGDCTAWMFDDFIVLETQRDRVSTLIELLDRFIIMDDVTLTDTSANGKELLLIAGPDAASLLSGLGLLPPVEPMQLQFQSWRSHELEVAQSVAFVPSFEIFADASVIAELSSALRSSGTANASPEALEQLRILSGTPLYGVDIRDKDLPQETNQTRALHFSKGCYLGQEIVERIRSRGAVHRTFTGFILHGDLPPAGTILSADDKPVGELTSVTSLNLELTAHSSQLSETSPLQIALGYIRREALERNAIVTYPGGTATAASLPFQLPELRALNV